MVQSLKRPDTVRVPVPQEGEIPTPTRTRDKSRPSRTCPDPVPTLSRADLPADLLSEMDLAAINSYILVGELEAYREASQASKNATTPAEKQMAEYHKAKHAQVTAIVSKNLATWYGLEKGDKLTRGTSIEEMTDEDFIAYGRAMGYDDN